MRKIAQNHTDMHTQKMNNFTHTHPPKKTTANEQKQWLASDQHQQFV